jgi:hypothetical protein
MKRRDEVLVGIFLTVAAAIALLGTLWLVRGGLSSAIRSTRGSPGGRTSSPGSRCCSPAWRSAPWPT